MSAVPSAKRLSKEQRATVHYHYRKGTELRLEGGKLTRYIRSRCKAESIFQSRVPTAPTVRKWIAKWNTHGFTLEEDRAHTREPRKMTVSVKQSIRASLLERSGIRRLSGVPIYSTELNKHVTISRSHIARYRRQELSIVHPKRIKVYLTAHHKKMRVQFCQRMIRHGDDYIKHICQADEKGFSLKTLPNKQNDVEYCEKGEETECNWFVVSDADLKNALNLYLTIDIEGVVFYHIFNGKMDINQYKEILTMDDFKDSLEERDFEHTEYQHDNLFKETRPAEELDRCFGVNRWSTSPPKPCRREVGRREVNRLFPRRSDGSRRDGTYRSTVRVYQANQRCGCILCDMGYPARSPDLNLTENAFAKIQHRMWEMDREDGTLSRKSDLKERLIKVIEELDGDKEWFKSSFESLACRYRDVIEVKGCLTRFHYGKYY